MFARRTYTTSAPSICVPMRDTMFIKLKKTFPRLITVVSDGGGDGRRVIRDGYIACFSRSYEAQIGGKGQLNVA